MCAQISGPSFVWCAAGFSKSIHILLTVAKLPFLLQTIGSSVPTMITDGLVKKKFYLLSEFSLIMKMINLELFILSIMTHRKVL